MSCVEHFVCSKILHEKGFYAYLTAKTEISTFGMHKNCILKARSLSSKCSYQTLHLSVWKCKPQRVASVQKRVLMSLPDLLLVWIYVALPKPVQLPRLSLSPPESRGIPENAPYGAEGLAVGFDLTLASCEL